MTRSGSVDTMPEQLDATGRNFAVRRMLGDELDVVNRSRLRVPKENLVEDLRLLRAGVLDPLSFRSGYILSQDPTEVVVTRLVGHDEAVDPAMLVRDPRFFTEPLEIKKGEFVDHAFNMQRRAYRAIRRQHNVRTTIGRDLWQRQVMFGDIAASSYTYTGESSASTATAVGSLTNTAAVFPTVVTDAVTNATTTVTSATAAFTNADVFKRVQGTNIPANTYITAVNSATSITISNTASGSGSGGTLAICRLQGKIIVARVTGGANASVGVIMDFADTTGQKLNVDQWLATNSSVGAASATPGATGTYAILAGGYIGLWVALCATGGSGNPPSGGHTPVAGDVARSADGLYGDGTATGAASEQTTNGLARAFIAPTFPAAGQISLSQLFTYTGAVVVTLDVAALFNSKAAAGSIPILASQLNASAAVSANGDTVTPTWLINL